jgi:hypothetical protein
MVCSASTQAGPIDSEPAHKRLLTFRLGLGRCSRYRRNQGFALWGDAVRR